MPEENLITDTENKTENNQDYLHKIFKDLFDKTYFIDNQFKDEDLEERNRLGALESKEIFKIASESESKYITPLFDIDYYNESYNFEFKPLEGLIHYLQHGWREHKNPIYLFSTEYYLRTNDDVREAGLNPLVHFVKYAKSENRNPHQLFDIKYYGILYPDILRSKLNPLSHYISNGFKENRIPHPLFDSVYVRKKYGIPLKVDALKFYIQNPGKINSTHDLFDGEYYARINKISDFDGKAKLEHYLENESIENCITCRSFDPVYYQKKNKLSLDSSPVIHYLMEGKAKKLAKSTFLTQAIKDQIESAKAIEPKVIRTHRGTEDLYQFILPPTYSNEFTLLKKVKENLTLNPDHIFLFSTMRRGGAELFALKIIQSLLRNTEEKVLIIYTDKANSEADEWIPNNPNVIYLDFQDFEASTDFNQRQNILNHIISITKPKSVMNINSWVGWEMYANYGKSLSKLTKLDTCLFCYDYDNNMRKSGYAPEYLRKCIHHLNVVITDNYKFKGELKEDLGLYGNLLEKIQVLHQPPDKRLSKINQDSLLDKIQNDFYGSRPIILWASRISKQKRPDILLRIAAATPEADFHLWGEGHLKSYLPDDMEELPENVIQKGKFNQLMDIPYVNATAFVHTCAWDGLPTMVLDMVNIGLPVIAPDIGGIRDLVNEETGWLIADNEDAEGYSSAVKSIISDPHSVSIKLAAAKTKLSEIHDEFIFDQNVAQKLNYFTS